MRKYENVKIENLIPYKNNARTHSEEQIVKIVNSIKQFGFINPVLVDGKLNIISGHGRVLAAEKMKLKEVPCLFIEDLTEEQKRAYIIADNRLALDAGWDEDLLKMELEELKNLDIDLSITGFDINEIDDILKNIEDMEESEEENGNPNNSFNYQEQYGVIVICQNEEEQEKIYNDLSQKGYECKVVAT